VCVLCPISQTTGAGRLKLGQRMHLLSSIIYTENQTLKLNIDAFITLNMNIDFSAVVLNLLVMDFPQLVYDAQDYNAPQMSELDLSLLWTALLHG
jgi:hypothetical protein